MIQFPIYRKYTNGKNLFKIESERSFYQIQIIGSKVFTQFIEAKQYPEIIFISTLIDMTDSHIVESNETEFEALIKK